MTIQSVVLPTDFSEIADQAVQPGLEWAKRWSARVVLLHVVESVPLVAYAPIEGNYASLGGYEEAAREKAEELLKQKAAELSKSTGLEVEVEVHVGLPGDDVGMIAGKFEQGLIVMSTHGRTGIAGTVIGSVAERTIRSTTSPILTAREWKPGLPKRILFATDLSPASNARLSQALEWSQKLEAELDCVTILDDTLRYYVASLALFPGVDTHNFYLDSVREARILIEDLTKNTTGFSGKCYVEEGTPHRLITELAEREKYDLIIVASHGRSGFRRAVLGSVAERVIRHAPCAVLTLPIAGDEED